jgi:glutamyl-tRNA synthetase
MSSSSVRVRFAPSPTGFLHVGGVRTALFNWLYARHERGAFVLRIEDTDETRHQPEAIEQIQRSLRWLGLDWDEGPDVGGPFAPYIQSERRARHVAVAENLLASGAAYRCYCTPDELERERQAALAGGRPPAYSGRCRNLTADERAALEAEGRRPAIRFVIPPGETVVDDLVRGRTTFENDLLGDHVLLRANGVPTYNFVNPVDDHDQGITHVIRGDDLFPSTPRQILLLRAMGAEPPRYGHLSTILGPDRKRLSKRHGATSVEEFRDAGYLPEAVVNYLALLGWSFDDARELFTREELVGLFSLERVNASPAAFDFQKLEWMNGVYLRSLSPADFAERVLAYLREQGSPLAEQPDRVAEAAPLVQEKMTTLAQFEPLCRFLFGPLAVEPEALERLRADEHAHEVLTAAEDVLARVEPWAPEAIEQSLRQMADDLGLKPRAAFGAIRIALTGRTVSPGLFDSAALLGRDETLARLAAAD